VRPARSIDERLETTGLETDPPAVEARPTAPEGEGRRDALLPGDANAADPEAQVGEVAPSRPPRRSTASGRQEEEAWAFLIRMPEETTVRLGAVPDGELIHPPTLRRTDHPCLTNPGNYT
jgi:hypothetical protein